MGKTVLFIFVVAILAGGAWVLSRGAPDIVVYSALDQFHAEPILTEFQKETGLKVEMHFDSEGNKTVGLTQTIMMEKSNPKCDVFWNNELVQTIRLKDAGVLQPYRSPSADDIPEKWKDPEGYWAGFAARARVIILNVEAAKKIEPDESKWPDSTDDFFDPKWKGQTAVAKPAAGTTLTHMAVIWAMQGAKTVQELWAGFNANETAVATSNSHVMRMVREGNRVFGFTDTDDFNAAKSDGYPVRRIFPDQKEGGTVTGCLVIPNSVSLVKNCPHPENAKKLIDYVLSRKVEAELAAGPSAQMPLRASVKRPDYVKSAADIVTMKVDWVKAAEAVRPFVDWYEESEK